MHAIVTDRGSTPLASTIFNTNTNTTMIQITHLELNCVCESCGHSTDLSTATPIYPRNILDAIAELICDYDWSIDSAPDANNIHAYCPTCAAKRAHEFHNDTHDTDP